MSLTHEQEEAIEILEEHKIICALPGSGKTHSLMALVSRILKTYSHSTVLLVTFTNAAATEMGERAKKILGDLASRVTVSTFASLILKQWKPLAAGRRLILGGEWQTYIRRAVLNNGFGTDSLDEIAASIEEMCRQAVVTPSDTPLYKIYTDYQNMMAMYRRADLNTISREVSAAISAGQLAPVRDDFVLCDEFQDVSSSDFDWIAAHIEKGKYVTVVGDDDQSIYSWRGAKGYENMVLLQEMYGATGYLFTKCFRCAPVILAAARKLIEHNQERLHKDMKSGRTDIQGVVERIAIPTDFVSQWTHESLAADSIDTGKRKPAHSRGGKPSPEELKKKSDEKAMERCRFVVEQIMNDEPFEWAILARINSDLDLMEQALAERRLNAVRLGGKSIFQSEHVHGVIKLLSGILQPKLALNLVEGLGWLGEAETNIQQIYYASSKVGFGGISSMNATDWLNETVTIHDMAQRWREDAYSPEAILHRLEEFSSVVSGRVGARKDKDFKLQLAVVKLIVDIIMKTGGTFNERVQNLLERITMNSREKVDHTVNDAVKLCTLTGSKGLEFKNVWIINVDEGKIPSKKAMESIGEGVGGIDEERRLLYVGMTRAEDRLRMSYMVKKPSMFMSEIFGHLHDNADAAE